VNVPRPVLALATLVVLAPSLIAPASAQPLRPQTFRAGTTVVLAGGQNDTFGRPSLQERVSTFPEDNVQRYVVTFPGKGKSTVVPYTPGQRSDYPMETSQDSSSVSIGAAVHAQVGAEIVRLTNEARARYGLLPVTASVELDAAASQHSSEMLNIGYFSHTSPTPGLSTPKDRAGSVGVRASRVSENLFEADGYPAEELAPIVVDAWLKSPGHRANMLDPNMTHVGLGVVEVSGKVSVTQMFGSGLR
jgi:uncharacterized protein YkwD